LLWGLLLALLLVVGRLRRGPARVGCFTSTIGHRRLRRRVTLQRIDNRPAECDDGDASNLVVCMRCEARRGQNTVMGGTIESAPMPPQIAGIEGIGRDDVQLYSTTE